MKKSLEYKILKHLSEIKNGKFIDISEVENNSELLRSVIKDLNKRELIETEPYPETPWDLPGWVGSTPSEKLEKCKILFSGEQYLESLKPIPIPKDRKIYLILFIIFSSLTIILAFLNYQSKNRNDILDSKIESVKAQSLIYKDSIELLKSQIKLYKQIHKIPPSKTQKSK